MTSAVIKSGKSQYLVNPGQEILVDKLDQNEGKIIFNEVLLLVSDDKAKVGTPSLSGVKVTGKVIGQVKGEKVRVSKYKAKSRYRKVTGIRPVYTKILIEGISEK